ncbi:enoyl-CoA hydratase/isomerase family protein [Nocardia vaccinii]|uniref:enoyl-CoA hydratase/isomerase family protein n=1 Tax=Nocardia vaccinii TaxID=1822 RepID=UPI0008321810|nr:enoyl-CoA hydratase/isomerase family protein [Nocardia vaccinii]
MAEVEWEKRGDIMVVTLNRPEKQNAVGGAMFRLLKDAFTAATADEDVRAIVTTGAGSSFCVGADIGTLGAVAEQSTVARPLGRPNRGGTDNGLRPLSLSEQVVDRTGPGRWMTEMLKFPKPTVAAVNGAAAGGGLCLAVMHDFRVAAADAKFAAGFATLGLGPEMGLSRLLPQLIGLQPARRMLALGEPVPAERAHALGLVDEIAEGNVLDAAIAFARRLTALPPLGVRAALELLASTRDGWDHVLESEYSIQRILFETADHQEAIAAFRERRAGTFEGH